MQVSELTVGFSDPVRSVFSKLMMKGQKLSWRPSTLIGGKAECAGAEAGKVADSIVKR